MCRSVVLPTNVPLKSRRDDPHAPHGLPHPEYSVCHNVWGQVNVGRVVG